MEFFGDYHTHTTFSHGKGSIRQNYDAAAEKGLKELGITDHGFSHTFYAVKREDIPVMRASVEALPDGVKTYLGIEANLMDFNGDIDIRLDEINNLDILIVGYHRFVSGAFMGFSLPNLMAVYTNIGTEKRKVKNTDALIKAIERFPIDIISHPGADFPIDVTAVAEACAHFGTFIELNGKRMLSDEDVLRVLKTDAMLIASSDAHSPDKIGDFCAAEAVITRLDVPHLRVANLEKFPEFRSRKRGSDVKTLVKSDDKTVDKAQEGSTDVNDLK